MCLHFPLTGNAQFPPFDTDTFTSFVRAKRTTHGWTGGRVDGTASFRASRDLFPEEPRWRVSFRDDWAILPTTVEVSGYHGYF